MTRYDILLVLGIVLIISGIITVILSFIAIPFSLYWFNILSDIGFLMTIVGLFLNRYNINRLRAKDDVVKILKSYTFNDN